VENTKTTAEIKILRRKNSKVGEIPKTPQAVIRWCKVQVIRG